MSKTSALLAPELAVSEWFNSPAALTLAALRGRPVFLHSFQLLCPTVSSNPSAGPSYRARFPQRSSGDRHPHSVRTPCCDAARTLRGFLHEYRIKHPVGVDLADELSDTPVTMQRFCLRGTPSSVLIGRDGFIVHHAFGVDDDIAVGARIVMALSLASLILRPLRPRRMRAPALKTVARLPRPQKAQCEGGRHPPRCRSRLG